MAGPDPENLAQALGGLAPKVKTPVSARVLNAWITQDQDRLGTSGPRLGLLVAATVVSAAMQRVVDDTGAPLFLLKGGTMLQYRLPGMSRTTQDIDGLIRGDVDAFLAELDRTLTEPWGPLTLVRGEVDTIEVPHRLVKPRRFDVTVLLNGVTWRCAPVEFLRIPFPSIAGFGLPTPDHLASRSLRLQIAQKIHAVKLSTCELVWASLVARLEPDTPQALRCCGSPHEVALKRTTGSRDARSIGNRCRVSVAQ